MAWPSVARALEMACLGAARKLEMLLKRSNRADALSSGSNVAFEVAFKMLFEESARSYENAGPLHCVLYCSCMDMDRITLEHFYGCISEVGG